jgi:hypothetical protein
MAEYKIHLRILFYCSSVEWSRAAGGSESEEDLPMLFLKVTPTDETLTLLKQRNRDLLSINSSMIMNDFTDVPRKGAKASAEHVSSGTELLAGVAEGAAELKPVVLGSVPEVASTNEVRSAAPSVTDDLKLVRNDLEKYSLSFFTRRNWKSISLQLWPGEYHIVCHIEFCKSLNKVVGIDSKIVDAHKKPVPKSLWGLSMDNSHRVWCQSSSFSEIHLLPEGPETGSTDIQVADIRERFKEAYDNYLLDPINDVNKRERWPFAIEHQQDAGPNGLMEVLYRIRAETKILMAEIYAFRNQHAV